MNTNFLDKIFDAIGLSSNLVAFLIISAVTSVVYYLNKVRNGEPFRWLNFSVNISVAMVMAFGADAFLNYFFDGNVDLNLEKFVMVFVGITGNKMMETISLYGGRYLEKKAADLTEKD